jgi:hypothetical protein
MSMRLLQKSAVNNAKTIDREREIAEGQKLAKRVDSLRELSAVEEKNLFAFRDKTMSAIRADMEPLHREKQVLLQDIKGLTIQKKMLLEPLDQKWYEVNKAQKICDDWEQELTAREDGIARREDKNKVVQKELLDKSISVYEKENLVKEIIDAATKMVGDAKEVLADVRNKAQTFQMQSEVRAASLDERETLLAIRERDVQTVKETNTKVRSANIAQQIRLASDRAALDAALKEKQ